MKPSALVKPASAGAAVLSSLLVAGTLLAASAAGTLAGKVKAQGGAAVAGATVQVTGTSKQATTGADGAYTIADLPAGTYAVVCRANGFQQVSQSATVGAGATTKLDFVLKPAAAPPPQPKKEKADAAKRAEQEDAPAELMAQPSAPPPPPPSSRPAAPPRVAATAGAAPSPSVVASPSPAPSPVTDRDATGSEQYEAAKENDYVSPRVNAFSTFSIDVDTASYSNSRRFLMSNSLPPKDAVRIEEFVNYFDYDYPLPKGADPFSITTEIAACPWSPAHRLVMIGLQGRKMAAGQLPPMNLVFLLDVSGSMGDANKLPLLKEAFKLLVEQLRPQDHVAIAVYAGAAGVVLPPTSGADKRKIVEALEALQSGGSTAGGEGIMLAYQLAKESYAQGGNNRVILATDGDFNVGLSDDASLVKMIEERRKEGIFLTVLGFGMGNYKDAKMEKLADTGNGNYAYIDTIKEAKKVLVNQLTGTLFTIAKDVKIQIEFNPAKVKGYRLVGYENRMLKKEDFEDDKKDAGELGAGHTVTAFYEVIPAGSAEKVGSEDTKVEHAAESFTASNADKLLVVNLRYKPPKEETSKLLTQPLADSSRPPGETSESFRFASAVAELALLLRDSAYKGNASCQSIIGRASGAVGKDSFGYRAELVDLAKRACALRPTAER